MIYSNPFSYPFAILITTFNGVLLLKLTFNTSHSAYVVLAFLNILSVISF